MEGVQIGLGLYPSLFRVRLTFLLVLVFGKNGLVMVIKSEDRSREGTCGESISIVAPYFLPFSPIPLSCPPLSSLLFPIPNDRIGLTARLNGSPAVPSVIGNPPTGVRGYIGLNFGSPFLPISSRLPSDGSERDTLRPSTQRGPVNAALSACVSKDVDVASVEIDFSRGPGG